MDWKKIKEKWPKITDDDWKEIDGRRDALILRIQERYGESFEMIESMLEELLDVS